MNRRLDDESASRDRYGRYYGQRSRVGSKVHLRLDARRCARLGVVRDARTYADVRSTVPAAIRREKQ